MAKAKQSDTLIVRGGGGAVWEVDDTPAIRDQINDGSLKLLRGPKTARKPAENKPKGEGGSEDVASGLNPGDEKPAVGEDQGQGD